MNNHILLVEDNPSDEKLTLLAFKRCGVASEIFVVRDGAAALERLLPAEPAAAAAPPLPGVVLLDLNLPKVGGLDVLRKLRADPRTETLPIVILTSSREEEDIVRSYSLGANAYVRKPVEYDRFAEAATALSLFWLLLNQSPAST